MTCGRWTWSGACPGPSRLSVRCSLSCAAAPAWGYIPGESFSIFDSDTLAAFQRCPTLRRDRDLERHNNGVTFVLL